MGATTLVRLLRKYTWRGVGVLVCFALYALRKRSSSQYDSVRQALSTIARRPRPKFLTSKANAWEMFLDCLGLADASPLRKHLRQLLLRPEVDEQLAELFTALQAKDDASSPESLSQAAVERMRRCIKGEVHVMLQKGANESLCAPTPAGGDSPMDRFNEIFSTSKPLSKQAFLGFAKLLIVRRVVRTLIDCFGIDQLTRDGTCPLPCTINVVIDVGQSSVPFRLHTITPMAQPSSEDLKTECLGLIEEGDTDEEEESAEEEISRQDDADA